MPNVKMLSLSEIFEEIRQGDFHASNELDSGEYPLISCSAEDNGIEGFFDLPEEKLYKNCITIASDGAPLTAFYHNYYFGAKDNVIVCIPKENTKLATIYYLLFQINKEKWRFSYGRKCYFNKAHKLRFPFPVTSANLIDEEFIESNFPVDITHMPKKEKMMIVRDEINFELFELKDLFDVVSGDYHVAAELDSGSVPLVSCGETNNGVIGWFDIPRSKQYSNTITIAYNGIPLTTRFHPYFFGAKDDVAVCINSKNLKVTTLLFIAYSLNKATWRFSYGRKCFKDKILSQKIALPIKQAGVLDEELVSKIVSNTPYGKHFH